ncbi:MAG: 3-oxoacyl-ACP reductase family protein [Candidatus Gottesmanbacteria bacterium]|nr:3-oxoacyl-ACP reductase family protein [Candidatus Gottesmanbacteria bacterium]
MKTKEKIVFVTGSSRGIGRAIALGFAREGNIVVTHASHPSPESKDVLRQIKRLSPKSNAVYFDITDPNAVARGCAKVISQFGHIDILVNNAGIVRNVLFTKMSGEDWDIVMKTNVYGAFFVTKQLLPGMIASGWGRIIFLSSISGQRGDFGQTNYSASKAALIGFTKSLAKEVARFGITVNAICPGLVDTEILKDVPTSYMETMIKQIPLGRKAQPEEIASLAVYLASPQAGYITGAAIPINGGWM